MSFLRPAKRSLVVAISAAILAASAACDTGPKEGEEAEYWGKKLSEGELPKREQAMQHLQKLRDKKSLPFLYDVLKSDVVQLKPSAAQLIGEICDESSVEPLMDGIDWNAGAGSDKKTRKAATANERIAKALGACAKPGDEKAIESLKRLAGSNHLNTQLAAVVALGDLHADSAVDDLIMIADGHENNFMVKNAVIALGEIGSSKSIPVLIKLLFFERGVSFYREASLALFQVGKDAVDPLFEVYEGKYEPIEKLHVARGVQQAKALEVLTDIGSPRLNKLVMETADIKADDMESVLARAKAHLAAGRLGLKDAAPILMKHWDDVDVSKSEFAIDAIGYLGYRPAVQPLLAMTTHAGFMDQCVKKQENKPEQCRFSEHQIRKVRLRALSRIGTGDLVKAWDDMVAETDKALAEEKAFAADDDEVQKQVGKAAVKGHEKTKEMLLETKPMIQAAAECGDKTDCWIGKLKDANPRVREKAAYELHYGGDAKATPALIDALADQDNEARYAAILAVWQRLPKEGVAKIDEILEKEKGSTQFIRINEDLKRLRTKLSRGY